MDSRRFQKCPHEMLPPTPPIYLENTYIGKKFDCSELKQRDERSMISQFNSSELKQCRERSVISQFNSSELKQCTERSMIITRFFL